MDERRWYEAEALMADLGSHRHEMPGVSEAEIEQRIRNHYPDAVAILVRERTRPKAGLEAT
jgi:hypothetical protein